MSRSTFVRRGSVCLLAVFAAAFVAYSDCPPLPPLGSVVADGNLNDEVRMVLDCDGDGIPDLQGSLGRRGFMAFRLDGLAPIDIQGPAEFFAGPDGFRDAGFSDIPACTGCVDTTNPGDPRVLSGVNTGQIIVIYLPDSNGSIHPNPNPANPGELAQDDSLLYVALDIFNGNPRDIGDPAFDVRHIDFLNADPNDCGSLCPDPNDCIICNDGVRDADANCEPDFLGIPFDVDSDGDGQAMDRWPWPPGCNAKNPNVDRTFEQYYFQPYRCQPTLAEIEASGALDFAGLIGTMALQVSTNSTTVNLDLTRAISLPPLYNLGNPAHVAAFFETYPFAGETLAQIKSIAQANNLRTDVEFIVRHIDTLVTTPANCPECDNGFAIDRFRFANGALQTFSDNNGDGSQEDFVTTAWRVQLPEIEVTKEIRCYDPNDPNDPNQGQPWQTSVDALPGSKLQFRITVENTGNQELAVQLRDVLTGANIDPNDVSLMHVYLTRPSDPAQNGEITLANAAGKTPPFNPTFFDQPAPGLQRGFLRSINNPDPDDPNDICLGRLLPIDVCTNPDAPILGDKVVVTFVARAGSNCNVDVVNAITAVGDPDITNGDPCPVIDPNIDANDVVDEDAVVDTPRETAQGFDDNVVTADIICRGLTFDKEVAYCTSCTDPNSCSPYGESAVIPPFVPGVTERCIRYRFTVVNNGDISESVTVTDAELCADVLAAGAEFVGTCEVCPPGVTKVVPAGGTATWYCMVRFSSQAELDAFLASDDATWPCTPPNNCAADPDCYCNCASMAATAVASGLCDSAPQITLHDDACVSSKCCEHSVTKQVACVPDPNAPYDPNNLTYVDDLDVAAGARVRFRIDVDNTSATGTEICRFKISDRLQKADGSLAGACASLVSGKTLFKIRELNGTWQNCTVPAGFKITGTGTCNDPNDPNAFVFDPTACLGGQPLQPGEKLRIEFEVQIANDADPTACDLTNKVAVWCAPADENGQCPATPLYCFCTEADATVDILRPNLTCTKGWAVCTWDENADCQYNTPCNPNALTYVNDLNLATLDGGLPIIFPAILCGRVTVQNTGQTALNVTVTDQDFLDAVAATSGVTFEGTCEFGQTKPIPIGGSATWTCCIRIPCREKFLELAGNDGGTNAERLENTATATGVPTGVCPGASVTSECSAQVRPTPDCQIEVTKDVVCVDCATGNPIGTPADSIEAGPGACVKWIVNICNTGQSRIPRIKILDDITPNASFTHCAATLNGTNVTSCVCPLSDGVEKQVTFAACRPGEPWLNPGECLVVEFRSVVNADTANSVRVRAFHEACNRTECGSDDWCDEDTDTASVDVKTPDMRCEKLVSVDYGDDGIIDLGPLPSVTIDCEDLVYPVRVKWTVIVHNDGEVPLTNVVACDPDLWAALQALVAQYPAVTVTCGLDPCESLPDIPVGGSQSATCEFVIPNDPDTDNPILEYFLDQDNPPDDSQYVNTVTVTADAQYGTDICPPGTPPTLPPTECSATLRYTCATCPETKVRFDLWNENEVGISSTERCVTAWMHRLLTLMTEGMPMTPNNFPVEVLGTNRGRAWIRGMQSTVCPNSINVPLLGVFMQAIRMGGQTATIGIPLASRGSAVGQLNMLDLTTPPLYGYDDPVPSILVEQPHEMGTDPQILDESIDVATEDPPPLPLLSNVPVNFTQKGSLLVYPLIELKWDAAGNLIQDTIITLTNDWGSPVSVMAFIVDGEPPGYPDICQMMINNEFDLTENEPCYWSVATGSPKGVSPLTAIGNPPIPDPDSDLNPGGTHLHGWLAIWAVDGDFREVSHNHLHGTATVVNYRDGEAWEYNAWAFQTVDQQAVGGLLAEPYGRLDLDGQEYQKLPAILLLEFFAPGAEVPTSDQLWIEILNGDLVLWFGINNLIVP